jgi:hypothetical protein
LANEYGSRRTSAEASQAAARAGDVAVSIGRSAATTSSGWRAGSLPGRR